MQRFRDQAERFGTRFITDQATKVELSDEPGGVHKVWVGKDEYARAPSSSRWAPSTRSSRSRRGGARRPRRELLRDL